MKQVSKTVNSMRPNLVSGLASAAVILSLSACGGDSLDNIQNDLANGENVGINVSTNDDGGVVISIDDDGAVAEDDAGGLVPGACPLVGNLQSLELASNGCQISGVLTESATLTADRTWYLEGALQIGSAETAATLNIEGGTQIRGDNQLSLIHISEPTRPY